MAAAVTDHQPGPAAVAASLLGPLRSRQEDMVAMLSELAEAESPTAAPESHRAVFGLLSDALAGCGLEVERIPGSGDVGDHLLARSVASGPTQLLLGHLDTVWPLGTLAEMPVERRGDRLHGPGVYDMKGGLVQLVFALGALAEIGAEPAAPPAVMIGSDEEIGSPDSRRHVIRLAREASRTLVLEPSFGPAGALKTARKGVGRFRVEVHGRASHAGIMPEAGVSAILELSRQVERLFELNDRSRGVTVNVGTIDGGLRANVVAPIAVAEVDARVPTAADARALTERIEGLEPVSEGVEIVVSGGFDRPPLEPTPRNRALAGRAVAIASEIGIELGEAAVGGASDGNLASELSPTLDGIGAVGHGAHAPEEHVLVSTMPERAALLAGLLVTPIAKGERG